MATRQEIKIKNLAKGLLNLKQKEISRIMIDLVTFKDCDEAVLSIEIKAKKFNIAKFKEACELE